MSSVGSIALRNSKSAAQRADAARGREKPPFAKSARNTNRSSLIVLKMKDPLTDFHSLIIAQGASLGAERGDRSPVVLSAHRFPHTQGKRSGEEGDVGSREPSPRREKAGEVSPRPGLSIKVFREYPAPLRLDGLRPHLRQRLVGLVALPGLLLRLK